jgi:hypothetical protein
MRLPATDRLDAAAALRPHSDQLILSGKFVCHQAVAANIVAPN